MISERSFPVEFVLRATPLSFKASRDSRERWKRAVADAARAELPEWLWLDDRPVGVTILYFPPARMKGDIDNIVKLILDALCAVVYRDDSSVARLLVQKFEPGRLHEFRDPTPRLAAALEEVRPVLYVRIDDDLDWGGQP